MLFPASHSNSLLLRNIYHTIRGLYLHVVVQKYTLRVNVCVLFIRNLFNETDSSNVSTLRNVYNGNGHHEYDTIPDVLEQMQLQQMEMVS